MTNQTFFAMIDKYEQDVINFLLQNPNKLILIRGVKFIGKTTIICKIFENSKTPVIYHTGCDPTKRNIANSYFVEILEKHKNQDCLVVLDEFYYPQNCQYFQAHPNFKVLLFVNSQNLKLDGFKTFDLPVVFEQYKQHFFGINYEKFQNKNIREIEYILSHKNFDENDFNQTQNNYEKMRSVSNFTQTKVKTFDGEHVQTIVFENNNHTVHNT